MLFGQQIQLLHLESKLTLEVSQENTDCTMSSTDGLNHPCSQICKARPEPAQGSSTYSNGELLDQQRVAATADDGKGNILRIMPGFATRNEGNPVNYGDVIILMGPHKLALHARRLGTTATINIEDNMYQVDQEAIVASKKFVTRFRAVPIT